MIYIVLFIQAKAYARANGVPNVRYEMDRSTVTYYSPSYSASDYQDSTHNNYYDCLGTKSSIISPLVHMATEKSSSLILYIFYLSNSLLVFLTMLFFHKMFLWLQQQGKRMKTLYKSIAIVLTFVNIILSSSDLAFTITNNLHFGVDSLMFIIFVKIPLVLAIFISETTFVCCVTTRCKNQNNRMIVNNKLYRIAHAFALCQIIWFMHRLVNDAIISIVFFIIAPAQTLGVVTLLLFAIASAIAFVAIILHISFKKKTCVFISFVAMIGITVCGLLFMITLFFIVCIDSGLKSAGMGGLILYLFPLLVALLIGIVVKQKCKNYRSTTSTASVDVEQQRANENTAAVQIAERREPDRSRQPLLTGSLRTNYRAL